MTKFEKDSQVQKDDKYEPLVFSPTDNTTIDSRSSRSLSYRSSRSEKKSNYKNTPDEFGFVGLLKLCCAPIKGEGDAAWNFVRDYIKRNRDNGLAKKEAELRQGDLGNVALHLACYRNPPLDVIEALIKLSPKTVQWSDSEGDYPIHYACRNGASLEVIEKLIRLFPESKALPGELGQTPLHCVHYLDESAIPSSAIIKCLLNDNVMNKRDSRKNTPFSLFAQNAKTYELKFGKELLISGADSDDIKKSIKLFLMNKPDASPEFMEALRKLPRCLLEDCVSNYYVKALLNEKILHPFTTAILILDFFMHGILLVSYTFVTIDSSNDENNVFPHVDSFRQVDPWKIHLIRFAAFYFAIRIVIEFWAATYSDRLVAWTTSMSSWIKLITISVILTTTHFISRSLMPSELITDYYTSQEYDNIRILFTVAGGVIWLRMLFFFQSINMPFSIFMNGAMNVINILIPIIISLGFLIGSFTLMFYTDVKGTFYCENQASESNLNDFCSFNGAFLKSFFLLMNATFEEENFSAKTSTLVLLIVFPILIFILILNIAVAVVSQSQHSVSNYHVQFWCQRFSLIDQIECIRFFFIALLTSDGVSNEKGNIVTKKNEMGRKLWSLSISVLFLKPSDLNEGIDCQGLIRPITIACKGTFLFFFVCFKTVSILFFIVIWIITGFATFGLLLPPQVRSWLFCPSLAHSIKRYREDNDDFDNGKEIGSDHSSNKMRNELLNDVGRLLENLEFRIKRSNERVVSNKIRNLVSDIEEKLSSNGMEERLSRKIDHLIHAMQTPMCDPQLTASTSKNSTLTSSEQFRQSCDETKFTDVFSNISNKSQSRSDNTLVYSKISNRTEPSPQTRHHVQQKSGMISF